MSEHTLEALVAEGRGMRLALGREHVDDLARLAYALGQDRARQRSAVLPPRLARPYEDLEDSERAGMRNAVRDSLVALVLLGYVEMPG